MSELSVGQLKGLATNSNVISVPSGHILSQSGSIIQVVQTNWANPSGNSGSVFTTTSTTPVNTGLSVTVTPKLATSKLLVEYTTNFNLNASSAARGANFWLYRDGVNMISGGQSNSMNFYYTNPNVDDYSVVTNSVLVNSNSKTATTIALWVACWNSGTLRVTGHDGQAFIRVMEIAQ